MSAQRLVLTLILVLTLLAPGASHSLAQPAASPAAPGAMLIVENAGQWPAAARFQVWNSPLGPGTTWLAEDAIWLVVSRQVDKEEVDKVESRRCDDPFVYLSTCLPPSSSHALKLTFPGSNPDVRIEPFDPLTTTVSYFIGNDPDQWHPAVPVWSGVRYADLYPGVDLVLGGRDGNWRLDAAPGAAVDQVRIQVDGASIAALNGATLKLEGTIQRLSIALPTASFAYQIVGQFCARSALSLTMRPSSPSTQTLSPEDDPGDLIYATFLGGFGGDVARSIATIGTGSIYVTGFTDSSDFPSTPGAFDPTHNGGSDVFVAKLNSTGSVLEYGTFVGGSGNDAGYGIVVDGTGSAYVTGDTSSMDFPTTPGAFDLTNNTEDSFIAKINPAGTGLNYATFLGGSAVERGIGIAINGGGSAYVTGYTFSGDFPTTPGAFDLSFNGAYDVYVAQLNPTGSGLVYATFLGGSSAENGYAIAVDEMGSAYVSGPTASSDFPTTPGTLDPNYNGGSNDAFIAKLNPAGRELAYATYLGGGSFDAGDSIALDATGSVYVTGCTQSIDFPTTPAAFDRSYNGGSYWGDAFVTKLSSTGNGLTYATFLGGSNGDCGYSIAVSGDGTAYVTGLTESWNFPITADAFDPSINSSTDAFVAKLNSAGSELTYGTFLGGIGGDEAFRIAADETGNAYVAGGTTSSDFPTTTGSFDTSFNGGYSGDGFVVKLTTVPAQPYSPNLLASIEQPSAGAFVSGAVTLRGFAIDLGSRSGTGIDMVHIYLDGPYGTGTIIGGATYGLDRPDIAAQYGARFGPSGWELAWDTAGLAPGVHRLYLYAHRTTDNAWSVMEPHLVVVAGGPARWLPIMLRQR